MVLSVQIARRVLSLAAFDPLMKQPARTSVSKSRVQRKVGMKLSPVVLFVCDMVVFFSALFAIAYTLKHSLQ